MRASSLHFFNTHVTDSALPQESADQQDEYDEEGLDTAQAPEDVSTKGMTEDALFQARPRIMLPLVVCSYNVLSVTPSAKRNLNDTINAMTALFGTDGVNEAGWTPSLCALDVICLQEVEGSDASKAKFFASMAKRGYNHVQVCLLCFCAIMVALGATIVSDYSNCQRQVTFSTIYAGSRAKREKDTR